ncbi:hypothetical protein D3C76_1214250 [compost metagenome]
MELKATNPAVYSGSPLAKSLQTRTIAIHLARPIMMSPIMYSGKSLKNRKAKKNIKIGPMIQFCTKESSNTFQSLKTRPSFSYFTLANGGYIITIRPTAIGIEVVPTCIRDNISAKLGINVPRISPTPIAPKIQKVK